MKQEMKKPVTAATVDGLPISELFSNPLHTVSIASFQISVDHPYQLTELSSARPGSAWKRGLCESEGCSHEHRLSP
jgi:hypothetical protein